MPRLHILLLTTIHFPVHLPFYFTSQLQLLQSPNRYIGSVSADFSPSICVFSSCCLKQEIVPFVTDNLMLCTMHLHRAALFKVTVMAAHRLQVAHVCSLDANPAARSHALTACTPPQLPSTLCPAPTCLQAASFSQQPTSSTSKGPVCKALKQAWLTAHFLLVPLDDGTWQLTRIEAICSG